MERTVIAEMSAFFDHSPVEFIKYLHRFIPERTPRRIISD